MLFAHYRLIVLSLAVSIAVFASTGWPVAAVATGVAVFTLPKAMTGRAATERIRKLEALELWTRRLAAGGGPAAGVGGPGKDTTDTDVLRAGDVTPEPPSWRQTPSWADTAR